MDGYWMARLVLTPWAFILVKKCPELLAYIYNHMAEPEKGMWYISK